MTADKQSAKKNAENSSAADIRDNPLLMPSTLPHGAPMLDKIKTEHFMPAVQAAIVEARENIARIKNNPALPGFKNTIEALEFSSETLGRVTSIFGNISSANSSDEIRAIESDIDLESVKFGNDVMLDDVLFQRVKAVHDTKAGRGLSPEQAMLLDTTYKSFVRNGALLSAEDKDKFRALSERLSELGTTFSQNTLKSTNAYKKVIDNEEDLKGVPERALKNYKQAAEDAGLQDKWLIKLSPPPSDILSHCENRALREEIYLAMSNVAFSGEEDNRAVVLEMVKLRHEKAQLLGFDNYASFVLEERMTKNTDTVMAFLKKNGEIYRPAAEDYMAEVKAYAVKTDGLAEVKPWDFSFYSRKLREEKFNLDEEMLRPYFDLEKVLVGLRKHAEKLFNIEMKETTGVYPTYHPDIKVYEVTDKASGEMVGLFYADYYARAGAKNGGAWMSTFRNRGIEDGENKCSIVTNTCNFDKPTKTQPTLLNMDEITTVFHEFGHGLHALLAKGDYSSITGTNVKWDFVELPSQLQENWAREKEVLDSFAVHYQTGEQLPAELIQKLTAMENFGAGYAGLRQTFQALLDMKWHMTDPAAMTTVEALEDGIIADSWLFPRADAGTLSTRFGHLFAGGYAAGYNSYKWAEVLEADIFSEFKEKGLYDPEASKRLRDTIYSQGGTVEPDALFVAMRGRNPDPEALFRREGILQDKKKESGKITPPKPSSL